MGGDGRNRHQPLGEKGTTDCKAADGKVIHKFRSMKDNIMQEVHAISNASVMKSIEAGCQTKVVPRGSVYWYMKHEGWMETHGKAAIYCIKLYLPHNTVLYQCLPGYCSKPGTTGGRGHAARPTSSRSERRHSNRAELGSDERIQSHAYPCGDLTLHDQEAERGRQPDSSTSRRTRGYWQMMSSRPRQARARPNIV